MTDPNALDLSTVVRAALRGWFLILIGVIVAVTAVLVLDSDSEPYYEASATFVVSPRQGNPDLSVADSIDTLDSARDRSIMSTYVEILVSTSVRQQAATTLAIDDSEAGAYDVRAVILPEANVIELAVTGADAVTAADLAGSIGAIAADRFGALYQIYDIVPLDPAVAPTDPANPPLAQRATMAAALGTLIGGAAALLYGLPRVRRSRQMATRLRAYGRSGTDNVTPLRDVNDDAGRITRVG